MRFSSVAVMNSPMHSDDIAISVRNLTKTYRLFGHPGDRIKQFFSLGLKQYHREFTALKDVSFDIKKGETVGIIGRNGSGKSTLLQLICGILKPSVGNVQVAGRISALLELGAGFNPEFTGRENVYFQGALMGFTQAQVDERFDDIAAFADIGEFIDQPVRTYSSGMFVRLAFSVAVHVAPDILVVDEALGVGDAEFQERSINRMLALQKSGVTILFVSHSIPAVRSFCQRALWIDVGKILHSGVAAEVCQAYLTEVGQRQEHAATLTNAGRLHLSGQPKYISILSSAASAEQIEVGESLTLHFELAFSDHFDAATEFGFGVIVRDAHGKLITLFNTVRDDIVLSGIIRKVTLQLPRTAFCPGRYWVTANVCDRGVLFAYDEREACLSFEVANATNSKGIPRWEGEVACEHAWLR